LARYVCALQAALAGRPSAVRAEPAAEMLTPHTPLPAKGGWNILPLLGMRPPDSIGLGMFLHGDDRFSHLGGRPQRRRESRSAQRLRILASKRLTNESAWCRR
jgi:hypothetical protein